MSSSEAPDSPRIASDRRLATILFADISGFTPMSEKMDAEIVSGLMNEIHGIIGSGDTHGSQYR